MYRKTAEELLAFIEKSPTSFHCVETMRQEFAQEGYEELREEASWHLVPGGRYMTSRNGSAFLAFTLPRQEAQGIRIMASHSDSPSFQIKENPEMEAEGAYVKLNVEKYGGMILSAWFDRPLSVAGRVVTMEDGGKPGIHLVNVDRDLLLIPNLAIHMNRDVNEGHAYNVQKELLPLFGSLKTKGRFLKEVARWANVPPEDILGHDLYLYNRMKGRIWGEEEEFLSSPRLDDQQCAFASMKGFLRASKSQSVAIHCVLDNEEVGSTTKQGAASTFLSDVLERIKEGLGWSRETYVRMLSAGFMLSADNAHAVHPNYGEKADPVNRPRLNEGIVLKYHAGQKYCTDAVSGAMFKKLCMDAGVPFQVFTNRSDMAGGSTLGNISNSKVALSTADVGLPQLAMHSPYETAGVKDTWYLILAAEKFFI